MSDILGVGDAGVDLMVAVPTFAGHDEKVVGTLLGQFGGGMVANFCCSAARLGADVALASVVGDDAFGDFVRVNLQRHGVSIEQIVTRPAGRTFFCVVQLDESGEKALTVARTDCVYPSPAEVSAVQIASARLVHITAGDLELAEWVVGIAERNGVQISLDIDSGVQPDGRLQLLKIIGRADLVSMNRTGYASLAWSDVADDPGLLNSLGARWAVVTLGKDGALAADASRLERVPSPAVEAVDTTGAGDCFAAALVVAYLGGNNLGAALRYATAAGALSVRGLGGHSAAPTHEEISALLANG
jgi:ribokinase